MFPIQIRFFALIFFTLAMCAPCTASDLKAAVQKAEKNITTEIKAQKNIETWEGHKNSLEAEIRDLQMQKTWLTYQNKKYTGYINEEQATLADLDARKVEMEQINMRLEPYLDEVVAELQIFIAKDLPFLPEERARRITFLQDSLNDYHLALSEKLRRILEAAQVEADYGRTLECIDTAISLNGASVQGRIFRLGRTALFFQSIDKKKIAFFDRTQQGWTLLPPEYERSLDRAMQIIDRKRAAELLVLPVLGGRS